MEDGLKVVCIYCDRAEVRVHDPADREAELDNAGWVPYKGGHICGTCQVSALEAG